MKIQLLLIRRDFGQTHLIASYLYEIKELSFHVIRNTEREIYFERSVK